MTESPTLGADLRRERERRGLALRSISENTKVSIALLEGLEADDISRWPGGIFRRAFVRAYAQCVGLDPDDVMRRFEQQFPTEGGDAATPCETVTANGRPSVVRQFPQRPVATAAAIASRARLLGTAADLTVATILALACAAAGSRLLWPVLLIACYYAVGVLITGTSPMVALMNDGLTAARPKGPRAPATQPPVAAEPAAAEVLAPRVASRQTRLASDRPVRQRRGMQAPV